MAYAGTLCAMGLYQVREIVLIERWRIMSILDIRNCASSILFLPFNLLPLILKEMFVASAQPINIVLRVSNHREYGRYLA